MPLVNDKGASSKSDDQPIIAHSYFVKTDISQKHGSDDLADKHGLKSTVYFPLVAEWSGEGSRSPTVIRDEYIGEWLHNKKHGKGSYMWTRTNHIYDGDWKEDQRSGFGTLGIKTPSGVFKKKYHGGWKANKRHGFGTQYYDTGEVYEGEWYDGKRCGWGRMHYTDGSVYEGKWENNMRHGAGMLRLANRNRYEGNWKCDKKNGEGQFFYLTTGQLYQGVWVEDIPKTGNMIDYERDNAPQPTEFPIPGVTLADPARVLQESVISIHQPYDQNF